MQTITRREFFAPLAPQLTVAEFVHERKPLPSLPFFHAPRGWTFKIPNERPAKAA